MAANLPAQYLLLNGSRVRGFVGPEYPHVGTFEGAARAARMHLSDIAPMAHGHFRNAYHIGPYIYKVGRLDDRCHPYSDDWNVTEYLNLTALRMAGMTAASPVALWYAFDLPVIAMPYFPNDIFSSGKAMVEFRNFVSHYQGEEVNGVQLFDLHAGNFRATATGRLRLVDLSEWW